MALQYLSRKEFLEIFLPLENEKEIYVIKKVKTMPKFIVDTVVRLANLKFIKYIRITDFQIMASSEAKPGRIKIPIIAQPHETSMGIAVSYFFEDSTLNFDEINSPVGRYKPQMVECILKDFPKDWRATNIMDWGIFWRKIAKKYNHIQWVEYEFGLAPIGPGGRMEIVPTGVWTLE